MPDSKSKRHRRRRFKVAPDALETRLDNAPAEPEPEELLDGRYRLVREVGRGGMGIVYEAFDSELEMKVALKVLPPELAASKRAVNALKKEAKLAMRLRHPNIAALYHFAHGSEIKFLVMELLEGHDLEELLAEEEVLELDELLPIARQVADAVDYAHGMKVVHRDIKPDNIFIHGQDRERGVRLTDFGIARQIKDSMTRLTRMDSSGTLLYMPPEQLQGRATDGRADIYALACTFYECLAGTPPFYRGSIEYQIVNSAPEPVDGLPEHVNAALLKGLAKDPEDRFDTASELVEALAGGGVARVGDHPDQDDDTDVSGGESSKHPVGDDEPDEGRDAGCDTDGAADGGETAEAPPEGPPPAAGGGQAAEETSREVGASAVASQGRSAGPLPGAGGTATNPPAGTPSRRLKEGLRFEVQGMDQDLRYTGDYEPVDLGTLDLYGFRDVLERMLSAGVRFADLDEDSCPPNLTLVWTEDGEENAHNLMVTDGEIALYRPEGDPDYVTLTLRQAVELALDDREQADIPPGGRQEVPHAPAGKATDGGAEPETRDAAQEASDQRPGVPSSSDLPWDKTRRHQGTDKAVEQGGNGDIPAKHTKSLYYWTSTVAAAAWLGSMIVAVLITGYVLLQCSPSAASGFSLTNLTRWYLTEHQYIGWCLILSSAAFLVLPAVFLRRLRFTLDRTSDSLGIQGAEVEQVVPSFSAVNEIKGVAETGRTGGTQESVLVVSRHDGGEERVPLGSLPVHSLSKAAGLADELLLASKGVVSSPLTDREWNGPSSRVICSRSCFAQLLAWVALCSLGYCLVELTFSATLDEETACAACAAFLVFVVALSFGFMPIRIAIDRASDTLWVQVGRSSHVTHGASSIGETVIQKSGDGWKICGRPCDGGPLRPVRGLDGLGYSAAKKTAQELTRLLKEHRRQ